MSSARKSHWPTFPNIEIKQISISPSVSVRCQYDAKPQQVMLKCQSEGWAYDRFSKSISMK
ncbi:hypothetical protein SK128_006448, partial [Halocaridina rubra]